MSKPKSPYYDLMFQNGLATKEYSTYNGMIQRCKSERPGYQLIQVDEYFLDAKEGFKRFLDDVGLCPDKSLELDRIRNLENYKPGNLRWVTKKTNLLNRNKTLMVELKDKTQIPLKQYCDIKGYSYARLRQKYRGGILVRNYLEVV